MCWGDDPADIGMFLISLALKCTPDEFRWAMKASKAMISVCLEISFTAAIYITLIQATLSEEDKWNAGPYMGYSLGIVLVITIMVAQWVRATKDEMLKTQFFLTYKIIDFLIGALNTAGIIYAREDIDTSDWRQMVVIVLVGCDVIVDPIQAIIACRFAN